MTCVACTDPNGEGKHTCGAGKFIRFLAEQYIAGGIDEDLETAGADFGDWLNNADLYAEIAKFQKEGK